MEILLQKVEEVFKSVEQQLRSQNNTEGFLQLLDSHWDMHKNQFMEIF